MGSSHKEWRKIAKRERRRKIRTQRAKARDPMLILSSKEHDQWLKEQQALEIFELEQMEQKNNEENEKWMKAEVKAQERWRKLQERLKRAHQQKLEKEAKIRLEWEEEQKRVKEAEERLKQVQEENERQQQKFIENLEQFLSGDSTEPPKEILISKETKPNLETCPFFSKTACCRFGDQCSRNHQYPGISKTLLAVNFYTHFGLDNSHASEYDTDIMLEYEEGDTHRDFKEFFYDVLPEFEKFGKVLQFKVCNNFEKHLRGNTYIEFAELRSAVAAYRALHSRWYGGRQISLQFCQINSWKNAICGLQSSKRCPKGRTCNFLHVFRNPDNLFNTYSSSHDRSRGSPKRTPRRSWRWSESPEVELTRRSSSSKDSRNSRTRHKEDKGKRREDRSRSHRRRPRRNSPVLDRQYNKPRSRKDST